LHSGITGHTHDQDAVDAARRKKLPNFSILVWSRWRNDHITILNENAVILRLRHQSRDQGRRCYNSNVVDRASRPIEIGVALHRCGDATGKPRSAGRNHGRAESS
jgi:hypothetical protein